MSFAAFDWEGYLAGLKNYEAARAADYTRERGGLAPFKAFLDELGSPQHAFRSVVIAGSKGKGSTGAFLEAMLSAAGHRVGLYTSPHLLDMRERIRLDGREISETELAEALREAAAASERCGYVPSWFEALTAAAFLVFRRAGLSPAVLEVGLGGRLDAVNVTRPEVVIITRILLEHTGVLGDSLSLVAAEKAAVVKGGSKVFSARQEAEAMEVIAARCAAVGASLEVVVPRGDSALPPVLAEAEALAGAAFEALTGGEPPAGTKPALRGRYEEIEAMGGTALLDAAHTPESVAALLDYAAGRYGSFDLAVGCFADKRTREMLAETAARPEAREMVFMDVSHPRALSAAELASAWKEAGGGECRSWPLGRPFPLAAPLARPLVVTGGFRAVERFLREAAG